METKSKFNIAAANAACATWLQMKQVCLHESKREDRILDIFLNSTTCER